MVPGTPIRGAWHPMGQLRRGESIVKNEIVLAGGQARLFRCQARIVRVPGTGTVAECACGAVEHAEKKNKDTERILIFFFRLRVSLFCANPTVLSYQFTFVTILLQSLPML